MKASDSKGGAGAGSGAASGAIGKGVSPTQSGHRETFEKVKTARGRKSSSTRWLQRQLNDPYVAEARRQGFRSRAAFKLTEMDDRFGLLKPGATVVDLGAAPGGWTQVAVKRVGAEGRNAKGRVVGIDILDWDAVPGAVTLIGDFLDPEAPDRIRDALGGTLANLVISDMAAATTGHRATDHIRTVSLAQAAWDFAETILAPGGGFVCKVFQGGTEQSLLDAVKARCSKVRHVKPPASRSESPELYLVATGFQPN
ncbi:MAG: RlmE family RNA methyltransferase [Rhodospirillaceae bacterium]